MYVCDIVVIVSKLVFVAMFELISQFGISILVYFHMNMCLCVCEVTHATSKYAFTSQLLQVTYLGILLATFLVWLLSRAMLIQLKSNEKQLKWQKRRSKRARTAVAQHQLQTVNLYKHIVGCVKSHQALLKTMHKFHCLRLFRSNYLPLCEPWRKFNQIIQIR